MTSSWSGDGDEQGCNYFIYEELNARNAYCKCQYSSVIQWMVSTTVQSRLIMNNYGGWGLSGFAKSYSKSTTAS
jgi:hypothetical protein